MKTAKTGDVLFVSGTGIIGNGIKFVTQSDVSHVGIIYNGQLIFETHSGQNARLNPIKKTYDGKKVELYRPPLTDKERESVINLCHKYNGSKYSNFDIVTNFAFSWLRSKARRKVVSYLGRKSWMICSEITSRILYEVNPEKFSYLSIYEGLRPDDLKSIAKSKGWKLQAEA